MTETLGAYIIAKNEESCIGNCLESLRGFDDVVILDTGSEDKTKEVASKYPCRFIADEYVWEDDFSKARMECMKRIDTDWLLVIDCDEELRGGVEPIRKAISDVQTDRFQVNTVAMRGGEKHLSIRLHRNKPESIFWSGACHNYLSVTGGPILDGAEVHYGYSDAHTLDPDRALRILTKACKKNPLLGRERYYLAREHYYRKNYTEAIKDLNKYFKQSTYPPERADAYLMQARCYWSEGDVSLAKDSCLQAIKLNANFREAMRLMASLSGPGNRIAWTRCAELCTNEGVIFVRGN